MIERDDIRPPEREELLMTLRHGLRQSIRLAEQLGTNSILGSEAKGMLTRLEAIREELNGIVVAAGDRRPLDNDPLWSDLLNRYPTDARHHPG